MLTPPKPDDAVTPEMQRNAAAFHEAGHAVMVLCMGGIINDDGVEIYERQYCGIRFYGLTDPELRERALVLVNIAGWRAERLWHGRGPARDGTDHKSELFYHLEELRTGEIEEEDKGDEEDSLAEMLRRTPDATDDELWARYAVYSSLCYALLRDPTIRAAVNAVATALVARGKLGLIDVLECIGGSTAPLVEAARQVERAWVEANC